ncbi:pyridoxal-phosphate dependent enzyme [Mesorhizobium sp. M0166]|uniref:pyridoxal-phosphate dependent enzyme n=1 Tax=Mesorhizobium sp. M0166 TaxID=2956902 RepID=UPI00333A601E
MSRIIGAEVHLVDDGFDIGIRRSGEKALYEVKARGGRPYAIPAGRSPRLCRVRGGGAGSGEQLGFDFDYVVVCTVTGSTHAGLLVGFAEEGRQRNVIGIDASATATKTKPQVLKIAQHTAELVDLGTELVEDDVVLLEDYAYPRYGIPSEGTKKAIRLCARLKGMITDPICKG